MKFYGKKLLPKLKGIKIIIITNNNRKAVKQACKYFKIKYNLLIANEDMKKNQRKHNAIKKTLKKLKLEPEQTFYVGDHINDITEAHKAGIRSVIVTTGVFKKPYIKKHHPDFIISDINKVLKLI